MRADLLARAIARQLEPVSDCAAFEAKCMVEHFCAAGIDDIYLQRELADVPSVRLQEAIQQRLQGIPLQYILGEWDFCGNTFYVNENVLIPRPETELLCECLADKMSPGTYVYDLCAGSGCIAISVAKATGAQVCAVEKYTGAFSVLQRNIQKHGALVQAKQWDITEAPDSSFAPADIILSNPPYIAKGELATLQREVQREPQTALDGGADGFDFYRAICRNFMPLLKPGGYAAFEIGEGQAEGLRQIFSAYRHIQTIKDYNGIERVVIFGKDS